MNYALPSNDAGCRADKISEDMDVFYEIEEGTYLELYKSARDRGYRYLHWFNRNLNEYDILEYTYSVTTVVR